MDEIDSQIFNFLKETDFTKHEVNGRRVFQNESHSSTQGIRSYFLSEYDSPVEAWKAETLTRFYKRVLEDGTLKHQSLDALERVLVNLRADASFRVKRHGRWTIFGAETKIPSGKKGKSSLQKTMDLMKERIDTPKIYGEGELFEKKRGEEIDSVKERKSKHRKKAIKIFKNKYFPKNYPSTDEEELEIISNAKFEDVKNEFYSLLEKSFPIMAFSGDLSLRQVLESPELFNSSRTLGTEDSLFAEEVEELEKTDSPFFAKGPSEQMHFLSAYPLKKIPSERDRLKLRILSDILGGSWTSPLMQIVREKHHLVYGIYSVFMKENNLFLIQTEHNPKDYEKINGLVKEIAGEVALGKFDENQFKKAKRELLEGFIVSSDLETCNLPEFRLDNAYRQFISKKRELNLLEKYQIITGITFEEVQNAAKEYLDSEKNQIFTYSK